MRLILLPQAVPEMIPPFNNLLIELLKATALVSVDGRRATSPSPANLVRLAHRQTARRSTRSSCVIYFVIAFVLTRLMRLLERRAKAGIGQAPDRRGRSDGDPEAVRRAGDRAVLRPITAGGAQMNWDWDVADGLPAAASGTGCSSPSRRPLLGSVLVLRPGAGLGAAALRSPARFVRWPVAAVMEFIRNTPAAGAAVLPLLRAADWGIKFSALTTGVIALGLHYSTYTAEVYRAGIDGVPARPVGGGHRAQPAARPHLDRGDPAAGDPPGRARRWATTSIAMLKDSPLLARRSRSSTCSAVARGASAPASFAVSWSRYRWSACLHPHRLSGSLLMRALERRLGH